MNDIFCRAFDLRGARVDSGRSPGRQRRPSARCACANDGRRSGGGVRHSASYCSRRCVRRAEGRSRVDTKSSRLQRRRCQCVCLPLDQDPAWRGRPRPAGRYISTAWIPGNFLAEGTFIIGAAITTLSPVNVRLYEREAIAFQVIDSTDGNSARGDYAGHLPGVVRPVLAWETSYVANVESQQPVEPVWIGGKDRP